MTSKKYFYTSTVLVLLLLAAILGQFNIAADESERNKNTEQATRTFRLTPQLQTGESIEAGIVVKEIGDLYAPEFYPNGRQDRSNAYIPGIIGSDLFNDISTMFSLRNDSPPMTVAKFQSRGANKNITYGSMADRYYGGFPVRPIRTGETVVVGMWIDNYKVTSGPLNTNLDVLVKEQKEPAITLNIQGYLFNGMGVLAPSANVKKPLWEDSFVKALPVSEGSNQLSLGIDRRVPAMLQVGTRIRVRCSNPKIKLKLEPISRPKYFKVEGTDVTLFGPQKWWSQDILVRGTISIPDDLQDSKKLGEIIFQIDKPAVINLMNRTTVPLASN